MRAWTSQLAPSQSRARRRRARNWPAPMALWACGRGAAIYWALNRNYPAGVHSLVQSGWQVMQSRHPTIVSTLRSLLARLMIMGELGELVSAPLQAAPRKHARSRRPTCIATPAAARRRARPRPGRRLASSCYARSSLPSRGSRRPLRRPNRHDDDAAPRALLRAARLRCVEEVPDVDVTYPSRNRALHPLRPRHRLRAGRRAVVAPQLTGSPNSP